MEEGRDKGSEQGREGRTKSVTEREEERGKAVGLTDKGYETRRIGDRKHETGFQTNRGIIY